ncbi:TonB-dependent receptor [Granulicella sibirica]|uniref:Oar protein n=1 Tax=Granulicella sibirica TaxID=2479048 RepID=A0A4Q0T0A7_9BACT|nr:carboxypeptidase regulatory-like domain-containing protein [Granulicella sibirica]RXH54806.1 Oar protein [Granulicella sibirica]
MFLPKALGTTEAHLNRRHPRVSRLLLAFLCLLGLVLSGPSASLAQTGGDGAIEGTVQDSTGAVVPNATVAATNINTGIVTTRTTTSAGFYSISPIIPGSYTVTVTAAGFQGFKQENLVIDSAHVTGLNVHLNAGSTTETVTVTDTPAALETTNAALGGTIENDVYTALPIVISGLQQRDVTQFSNLLPGAQTPPGGRSSIIGGTAQRLGELYIDGLPLTTISQQGDNRPVFNIVPLEAIDSIQVVTSGFSAQYQGAGLENYATKSGGNKYHGSAFEYIRNTAFDAWSFSAKPGGFNVVKQVVNGVVTSVPGPKTPEHQNEFGFTIGGPVKIPKLFNGHDKLFFFATYDKFHSTQDANPTVSTLPTILMRNGDFRELIPATAGGLGNTSGANYPIYDPTTQAACTANSTTGACRYQYGYGPGGAKGAAGAPVANGAAINVIPASEISPIAQYLEKFLPAPSIDSAGVIQNNYVAGIPSGYQNWLYSGRVDYTPNDRNRLSFLLTGGNRHAIPYTATTTNFPVPYLVSTLSTVAGHYAAMEDSYTITPNLVNQFKFGFMNFGGPPIRNPTNGITQYEIQTAGVTGLPAGQASENFPGVIFGGSNAQGTWATPSTGNTSVSETYTLVDNLQWVKGKHAMTFGFQYQWLENNASTADTGSLPINLNFSTNDTGNLTGSNFVSGTGYSYASYILGAVGSTSVTQQSFSVLGGRFHPISPYFQDDWKVTPKLTLNLGLRWDYFPTYNEVLDRWSFLNPNITNPITGNMGALQFAGDHGGAGVSCGCRSPVNSWKKNFGPRIGFAYAVDDKTVFRGAYAILYSHGGGTGGAGGAGTGTGQAGFNSTASFTDNTAGPAFYLNNNAAFSQANANFGGPGYTLPAVSGITTASQALNVGYYLNGTGGFAGTGSGIAYADPYLGGRAPESAFFNFGMQREFFKNITMTANYVGTQSHFLAGAANIRGLQSGQLDPRYLALGSYLAKPATAANIAAAQTATGVTIPIPYAAYTAAAGVSTTATIAHMLTWMPQYAGTTDTWGTVANSNYNAFQLTVDKRFSHGLTMTVNYTYSRNIDDAGTARSGWAIPASATSDGRAWAPDRIDRSLSLNNLPQALTVFGVYKLPFGKGGIGSDSFLVRALAGGWQFSEIYQYSSGLPLAIVGTCNSTENVGQGTCMPDFNPSFHGDVRTGGGWGQGATAANLATKSYLTGYVPSTTSSAGTNGTASVTCSASNGPFCNSRDYSIGNLTRIAPYGLRGQNPYRLAASLSRTFDLSDRFKFIFRADCQNVTNHTTFGNNAQNQQVGLNVNSSNFGTLNFASTDSRAFQFSGRISF